MKHRGLWFTATALLASASGVVLYQRIAGAELARQLEASLMRVSGVRFSDVHVDPWSGKAVVHGLRMRAGRNTVSAGRLVFDVPVWRAPSLFAPAFAAGESATAENIVISFAGGTVRIPKVEAIGTSLTGEALAKIFDAADPAALPDRMKQVSAEKITIPTITVDIKTPDLTEKVQYRDLVLESTTQGKVGQFSSTAGSFTLSGTNIAGTIDGSIGGMRGRNLDLLMYVRFLAESRKAADEPLQTVYNAFQLDGLEAKGKDFALKVGAISGENVKARPLAVPISKLAEMMPGKPGQKPTPEQNQRIITFLSDLYSSMAVGKIDSQNISVTFGHDEKSGSLQISHASMNDFADARLGGFSVDGFRLSAPDALVSVDKFNLRGFDFKSPLRGLSVASGNGGQMQTVNPRTFIPTLQTLVVAGVDADVRDKKRRGNTENGTRTKFKLAKFQYDGSNYELGVPTTLSATLERLALDLPENDASSKDLLELGYHSIDVSSRFEYAWSEADSTLTLKNISASGEGMGAVALTGLFGNVTRDLFVGDAAVAQAALLAANIKNARLRLDNSGLFGRLLEQAARRQGKTVDQVRQEAVVGVQTGLRQLFGDMPQATSISDAVVAFLKDPKSLQIVARSARGVSAADLPLLQNPPEFLRRIDVTATANQ